MTTRSIYKARWLVPIDAPPIENGRIVVEDGIIVEASVAPRSNPEARDFGNAILMPGFVNAHTHLEYTVQRGLFEDIPFFPWIRALTAAKSQVDANGWLWSAKLGALETIAAGVTTVADNTDAGVTSQVAAEAGLRACIFQEVFGIDNREPVSPIVESLKTKLAAHRRFASDRVLLGVSPHALYTVRPALFAALKADPEIAMLPWSIHVAESTAETQLMSIGTGPFVEMFDRRGIAWNAPEISPTAYAARVGALGPTALAVHCVHQTDQDIALLRKSGAAIIHCPKSNGKLGAGIAPLAKWLGHKDIRIGLGTDSAVSNNNLDMFEEMRFALLAQRAARQDVSAISAKTILHLATLGGANALGIADKIGSLTPGKRADFIAVSLDSPHVMPVSDPIAALVYSARASDVVFTACNGVPLYDSGQWLTLDCAQIMAKATEIRHALDG